jgi:U3 small nucleolar RNA-associated protein 11
MSLRSIKQLTSRNTAIMSSLRNAVQRRNHKERAQPLERQKWGLLEKHKDYSLRAADHNAKKRKLNALRQKASERNEDEFYFGMMSNTSAGGIKRAKRGEENGGGDGKGLGQEVARLMKTQDEGYLRTVLQSTRATRERVEREVLAAEVGVPVQAPLGGGKKIVFGEDGEEAPAVPLAADGDDDDLAGLDDEDESEEDEETEGLSKEEIAARRRKKRTLHSRRRVLEGLRDREARLASALREVEEQRARMNGTVRGVNKNGIKFKRRERKK